MDFLDLAKSRYSCRSYSDKKVEKEKLDLILEAGRIAPTGANRQPQRLIVIREKEGLERLSKAAKIYNAPLAIIICGEPGSAWIRPYDQKNITDIDASIVTDHMMLEAAGLGLNTLWICYFKPDIIKSEFNIPDNIVPINILAIGYGNTEPMSPNRFDKLRKPLSETVFFEGM